MSRIDTEVAFLDHVLEVFGGLLWEISEKMTSPFLFERMAQKFAQIWGLITPSLRPKAVAFVPEVGKPFLV